jgi:hypothetical protein
MAARRPRRPHRARLALWLPLLLLVPAVPALAQERAAPAFSIGPGRLYTTEGWEVAFSEFTLLDLESARYRPAGERGPRLASATTLLRVQKVTGHEGRRSAVVGGACGLVGGTLGVWLGNAVGNGLVDWLSAGGNGASTSDHRIDVGPAVVAVSACGLLGAVGGYQLGAREKHYTTVYEDPSLKRP